MLSAELANFYKEHGAEAQRRTVPPAPGEIASSTLFVRTTRQGTYSTVNFKDERTGRKTAWALKPNPPGIESVSIKAARHRVLQEKLRAAKAAEAGHGSSSAGDFISALPGSRETIPPHVIDALTTHAAERIAGKKSEGREARITARSDRNRVYVLQKATLGTGGYGVVRRGLGPGNKELAIKKYGFMDGDSTPHEFIERAEHEFAMYQKLGEGKHFPKAYDILHALKNSKGEIRSYLVMDLLEGDDLNEALSRLFEDASLSVPDKRETIREMIRQCIQAVDDVHAKGIAHKDVSLANFFYEKDGTVKIFDFNLAMQPDEDDDLMNEAEDDFKELSNALEDIKDAMDNRLPKGPEVQRDIKAIERLIDALRDEEGDVKSEELLQGLLQDDYFKSA